MINYAINHNELYTLLNISEEVIQKLNAYAAERKTSFSITIESLIDNPKLIYELDRIITDTVTEDPDGIKILWEELNIARQSYCEYRKKEIPTNIFIDTMKFCTRFLREYHKVYGCYRFIWGWWFPRQLSLREFRIGALEYEFEEKNCVHLHIPSDAVLTMSSVLDSLSQFRDFCKQYYPEWETARIDCESWLLSPALKNILTDNSNILAFQKLFDVTETDYESMAVLDWVFPGFNSISDSLPEKTSLQRNMKKYLLAGEKVGWSKGILHLADM